MEIVNGTNLYVVRKFDGSVPPVVKRLNNYRSLVEKYVETYLGLNVYSVIRRHFEPENSAVVYDLFRGVNKDFFMRKFFDWFNGLSDEEKSQLKYLVDKRHYYTFYRQMVINWVLEYAVFDYVNSVSDKLFGVELLGYRDGDVFNKKLFSVSERRELDYLSIHGLSVELQSHPFEYFPDDLVLRVKLWKLKRLAFNYPGVVVQLYLMSPHVVVFNPLDFMNYWRIVKVSGKYAVSVDVDESVAHGLVDKGVVPRNSFIKTTIYELPVVLYNLSVAFQNNVYNESLRWIYRGMVYKYLGVLVKNYEESVQGLDG